VAENSEVAYSVLRAIRRIVRRISDHSKVMAREAGLTVPQLIVVKAIGELEAEEPEVTAAMVAQQIHLSPATVTRIVDRLEKVGLVARERRSKDRRKICLSLTNAGIERFQTLPIPLQDEFLERLMDLDEDDRVTLLNALNRITELMEAEHIDAAPLLVPESDVKGAR
jgi:DNA-binding MarR family transcriptional regulator